MFGKSSATRIGTTRVLQMSDMGAYGPTMVGHSRRDIGMRHESPHKSPPPADQHTVRRHNLALVLDHVGREGRHSRARISSETGLNPSTVSSLTAELIQRGLVREIGLEKLGTIGRPGRGLELNPDGGIALGLEISDDGLAAFAVDVTGASRYRAFVQQDNRGRSPAEIVTQLAAIASEALQSDVPQEVPVVTTFALPGLVSERSEFLEAPNLGWHEIPVLDLWRKASGRLPLQLDNEARLAAYAEMTLGAGSNFSTFAYVSGGTGLGAGIVINRHIYRGAHGFAGEFGHITIEPDGPPSAWGALGTLETLAGERALADLSRLQWRKNGTRSGDPDRASAQIAALAKGGDTRALSALEKIGRTLGVGLATLSNLLDLEAIILGGYLTHLGEWLREPIERELQARILAHRWSHTSLFFSTLGREAAVRGAARRSLRTILEELGESRTFDDNTPGRL